MSVQPLFTPLRMGDLDLPNRIVMAPLTRMRAGSMDHVPTALQAEYYAQRASAGLIVAEATAISADGFGYADTPGLWSADQVRGWRLVTDAVHATGGRIIAQLWHTGAIAHPDMRYTFPTKGLARDRHVTGFPELSSSASPVSRRALKFALKYDASADSATPAWFQR